MKRSATIIFLLGIFTENAVGQTKDWRASTSAASYIHQTMKKVTDIIVHDVFSPPVASRTYAYISVAGYEAGRHENSIYKTLVEQLHGFTAIEQPQAGQEYSFPMAAAHAMLLVAKTMVVSEDSVLAYDAKILQEFGKSGMPQAVWDRSKAFGEKVAADIIQWAAKDNYKYTRSLPKYTVSEEPGSWQPTAPAYMKAVEPHWSKMRTFVIDSAQQFKPVKPFEFSTEKGSPFYKMAMDVYKVSKELDDEKIMIANFWDCNPFKMNVNGHVMYATKKISPGGHWINIAALACKKTNADLVRSLETYVCLSITLADAFIICWDEKYRSKVIRPETYISNYIDGDWMPILQTPPFPEYTSGHSVISAASAVLLTKLFGDGFAYTDDTELEFGIPERKFKSFRQAAEEAAISRLYGGIHYNPAIVYGMEEGTKMGALVASIIKIR